MRAIATIAVVSVVALAGCTQTGTSSSSGNFTGQQKQVADTIAALQKAGSSRKPDDVCNTIVTSDLRASLAAPNSSCSQEVKKAMDDADSFDLSVDHVSITGSKATAQVSTKERGKDVTRTFELSQQTGGGWRISSFG